MKNNPLQSILNDITRLETQTELNEVIRALKDKQHELRTMAAIKVKRAFSAGDLVKVRWDKNTCKTAEIVRIMRTKALVDVNGDRWRVPLNLIEGRA